MTSPGPSPSSPEKIDRAPRGETQFVALAAVWAALVVGLRYRAVPGFWWNHDDLELLNDVVRFSPFEYFTRPEVWQDLHGSNFTPWHPLLYDLSLAVLGPDPRPFHLVHVSTMLVAVGVTVAFLRHWVGRVPALFGAALFALSGPAVSVGSQLMNGHYLQGLVFFVGAWILFVRGVRTGHTGPALGGAALYFLAVLCKEIYVPLPLLLLVTPEGSWRGRIRACVPFGAVLAIAAAWRFRMLGGWISEMPSSHVLEPWIELGPRLPSWLIGDGFAPRASLVAVVVVFLGLRRRPRDGAVAAAGLVVLVLPLVTIANRIDGPERALVLWAWTTAVGATLLLSRLARGPSYRVGLALLIGSGLLLGSFRTGADVMALRIEEERNYRVVGQFVEAAPSEAILSMPGFSWVAEEAGLWRRHRNGGEPPRIIASPDELGSELRSRPVFEFLESESRIRRVEDVDLWIEETRSSIRTAPLAIELRHVGPGVDWRFAPYRDRGYSVWGPDGQLVVRDVMHRGYLSGGFPHTSFQLRYASPEGWQTRSDWLEWRNEPGERLAWSRGASRPPDTLLPGTSTEGGALPR